jgi:hypothetical protein
MRVPGESYSDVIVRLAKGEAKVGVAALGRGFEG